MPSPKPSTMKLHYLKSHFLLFLVCLLARQSAPQELSPNALPEGAFEQLDSVGKPVGWNWNGVAATFPREGGNGWVRFGDGATTGRNVRLDPRWKSLLLSAKLKLANFQQGPEQWHGGRVALRFLNDQNEMAGTYPAMPQLQKNSDWTTQTVLLDVPPSATQLQIQPGLWGSKGIFELDDLVVRGSPLSAQQLSLQIERSAPGKDALAIAAPARPVTELSARRASQSLNGVWRFVPALGPDAPAKGWGQIAVPGSWMREQDLLARGTGPNWSGFTPKSLAGAWYERTISIPAAWQNRAVILDFERVSTDATIYVNNRRAGQVNWSAGQVDITDFVVPGQSAQIRVFVVATTDQKETLVLMGGAPGQTYTVKSELPSGGLIGDVSLQSRPRGAWVSDVFIQPSFRQKKLTLDVELYGAQPQSVQLVASLENEKGLEEKRFVQTMRGGPSRLKAVFDWPSPRLWDLGQPNLYTLKLQVRGGNLDDEWAGRFGFREFWIEGTKFLLNGKEFRMRPVLAADGWNSNPELLDKYRMRGFNIGELWPEDYEIRGKRADFAKWHDIADEKGFPLTGIMPHMGWMGNNINTPEKLAAYARLCDSYRRKFGNHPSIVMWGTSGNMKGGALDPRYVGRRAAAQQLELKGDPSIGRRARAGVEAIRQIDPTRPIFVHNGGPDGDVYTVNNYLNFIPLQEREEWLSNYAKAGDMPLFYVEWGTPLYSSFMRGRHGYGNTTSTEPFVAEYCAIYQGKDAYKGETPAYRQEMAAQFVKEQEYRGWHANQKLSNQPNFLALQELFSRQTWRSWRTWGTTGGMIPWDNGYAELGAQETRAGRALRENNSATLAWICGPANEFTDKTHLYAPRGRVRKAVALLNDTREPQQFSLSWRVVLGGKQIATGRENGALGVAQTIFKALEFALPPLAAERAEGQIFLDATIGNAKHSDSFAFSVHRPLTNAKGSVLVFDPVGKTTALLKSLGYQTQVWTGQSAPQLLVVGRESLSRGAALPGDLEAFARNGGRVLVMEQNPHWLRENMGWRVSHLQSRRVFRVMDNHPVAVGLKDEDLRDWRGHSTLLEPYPDYENGSGPNVQKAPTRYPYAGWRWGTRGTVASAAIEKPHRSGWRPILECEFDLAYSPLMELDFGRGRVTWCQLDLEDHTADPAARRLTLQLLSHAQTAPLMPRAKVVYIGGADGASLLKSFGVQFRTAPTIEAGATLVVLGANATLSPNEIETFARNGGRVLCLARTGTSGALGVALEENTQFNGTLDVPNWPEARGLSASDLRWRNAGTAWLLKANANTESGAAGQLGRRVVGNGVILWAQIDPKWLRADEKTYLRLTRWRQTRALSQILANLGASFELDARVFHPALASDESRISLTGTWQGTIVERRDAAPSPDKGYADPGLSGSAKALLDVQSNAAKWTDFKAPAPSEALGGGWENADGEFVFRRTIDIPAAWQGKDLVLSLGSVDDNDETYFNGERVGGYGDKDPNAWNIKRVYSIPARLVKPGKNVVTVRVWDRFGGGGFTGRDEELFVRWKDVPPLPLGFYHPDYRADFDMGDEPYRYYNW